ncbi:hypothetical protein Cgig2_014971 [Carnegiea gigantea]|uniref:Uncharacterized protein n=1 Tax=Carnegiea gigantea TaxID=171969 RepID=A0A9Q1JWK7_9CARY|nr:hypothetical protein Cgig2_014971 [Carnegiea gigantea]
MVEGISDHCSLKLKLCNSINIAHTFKYYDMWSKDHKFQTIVREAIHRKKGGTKMLRLLHPLNHLNANRFRDIYTQLEISRAQLENTQGQLHHEPLNEELQAKERAERAKYLDILDSSIMLMRQQSKLEWINSGDHYTKLFFAKMKQRKQANCICSLNDDKGNRIEGFTEVTSLMTEYYKKLIGDQTERRAHISDEIMQAGPGLTTEQQILLCSEVTNKEIKEVFFSIPNEKSRGPDGYSSGFFKAAWQDIGPLVCKAV